MLCNTFLTISEWHPCDTWLKSYRKFQKKGSNISRQTKDEDCTRKLDTCTYPSFEVFCKTERDQRKSSKHFVSI